MNSHKRRMGEIGFWAIPPNGSPERAALDKEMAKFENDPRITKQIKKTFERAHAAVTVQLQNGLGFPADQMLREYNAEYNGRVFKGSLNDLPGSFNVVEAFNKFLPPSATFELRKEKDHLFSFDDFVDHVTEKSFDDEDDRIKEFTENGTVYSYNSTSDPLAMELSAANGEKYGFSSVSLVRFGDEVSMVMLAGQACDLEKKIKEIREKFLSATLLPHRTHIAPDPDLELRAVPLSEGSNLWKTVVLTRFDLSCKTIDVRYVYQDWGHSYQGLTDDRDSFVDANGKFFSPELEKRYERAAKSLDVYQALFELCKTCLLMPKYFHERETDIEVERHPTNFLEFRKKLANRKLIELANPSLCLSYREAYVLSKRGRRSPTISTFIAPDYKVETSGYWKKLSHRAEGRDKNGRPIHGRTWVSQILSWVEDNTSSAGILVEKKAGEPSSENSGYIYVMRSAAHEKDIFKVGLTRRTTDIRAKELSRSTSSPDHFLVVEEWSVSNCVLAEKLIHEKLKSYRINPNREYFKARYSVIFSVIDEVISSLDSTHPS